MSEPNELRMLLTARTIADGINAARKAEGTEAMTLDELERISHDYRVQIAAQLGCNPPSDECWREVVKSLRIRERVRALTRGHAVAAPSQEGGSDG